MTQRKLSSTFCCHKHHIYLKDCDYKSTSLLLTPGQKLSENVVVNSFEIVFSASFQKLQLTDVWPLTNGIVSCRPCVSLNGRWPYGPDVVIKIETSSSLESYSNENISFPMTFVVPLRKGRVILFSPKHFSSSVSWPSKARKIVYLFKMTTYC